MVTAGLVYALMLIVFSHGSLHADSKSEVSLNIYCLGENNRFSCVLLEVKYLHSLKRLHSNNIIAS